MGMNVQGRGGNQGGYGYRNAYRPMAEINVTPFIDVMLVLLIVFMVTAPLLSAGVQVDLPKTEAGPVADKDEKPLEVAVNKKGDIFIGETKVTKDELMVKLSAITGDDFERRVFIKADQGLPYGDVMGVLGSINKAGYRKVALITEPTSSKR
ncbi:MAG: protein TolR [Alphaproteobacteria bacterium]|jgi:biopolymer transport protein TolR|nr:protein TolR [Alphaproteobacteria bacterium]MCB1551933.1 protein TolR [Alphaproteobacteria bacterium]MCB9984681.1 protein TolR [Micavibrio sp.]HPQ50830.1 protein TolR [Alphaproteobacteria bacterium]HRK98012.1 protein TolR [Alphaproteobacteria bacterium]